MKTPNPLINQVIRSRRRTLELQVAPDATLIVRAPFRVSMDEIQRIVSRKLPWILEKQKEIRENYHPKIKREFAHGEEFLYLGQAYKLCVVDKLHVPLLFNGKEFLLRDVYRSVARNRLIEWYQEKAQDFITGRVEYYSGSFGFKFSRIAVTNAARRWGSCGPKNTLNFSWRLIMAPAQVVDYVVVHELVHLHEHNHSKKFWDKVKILFPEYKEAHRWLRLNHSLLVF